MKWYFTQNILEWALPGGKNMKNISNGKYKLLKKIKHKTPLPLNQNDLSYKFSEENFHY